MTELASELPVSRPAVSQHSKVLKEAGLVLDRITAGHAAIFYAPDVVSIADEQDALVGLVLCVGDGAAVTPSIVRRRDGRAIGHASIRAQLHWCAAAGVHRAVFTHCGSEIVRGDARTVAAAVRALCAQHGIEASIAHDGLEFAVG